MEYMMIWGYLSGLLLTIVVTQRLQNFDHKQPDELVVLVLIGLMWPMVLLMIIPYKIVTFTFSLRTGQAIALTFLLIAIMFVATVLLNMVFK